MTEGYLPPTSTAAPGVAPAPTPRTGVGALRHLLSIVIALVTVPIAYVAFDFAISHGLNQAMITLKDGVPPLKALVPFVLGVVLFFVAAACGRLSGLGPLLAGIVWGAVPGAWDLFAPISFGRTTTHLPRIYDQFSYGLVSYGLMIFPIVGALLIGCAISARWK